MRADRPETPETIVAIGSIDPSGCEGIAADLRTFAAMGTHGAAVVTGALSYNKDDRAQIFTLPADCVARQIEDALDATRAPVVKIGSLPDAETVTAAARALRRTHEPRIVLDPDVAHADQPLKDAMKSQLIPIAELVTVSMTEAAALLGIPIRNSLALRAAGKLLARAGAANALIKGAHLPGGECVDVLWDGSEYLEYPSERIEANGDRGAGCTLASAIAAGMAHRRQTAEAIAIAKMYVTETLRNSYPVGARRGSPSQLYRWWETGGRDGYGG